MAFRPLDLFSDDIKNGLRRIQRAGKASLVSISFQVLCEEEQTIELRSTELSVPHLSHDAGHGTVAPRLGLTSRSLPPSGNTLAKPLQEKGHFIYPVGSCTKSVLFVAYVRFIRLHGREHHISWETPACTLLNEWLVKVKGGGTSSIRLKRYPTIIELFQHINGFADMNLALFAPDGKFIMPATKVLRRATQYTNARYGDAERGQREYSNVNYIFLGFLLELIMDLSLAETLKKLVFDELKLKEASMNPKDLMGTHQFAEGFQISANGDPIPAGPCRTLNNIAYTAPMGLWISASDMTKFLLEVMKALEHDSEFLTFEEAKSELFWDWQSGAFGKVDNLKVNPLSSESPTTKLDPTGYHESELMIQHKDDKINHIICHKGGYVDGFSSVIVLIPEFRAGLTILANSTGALDVAHHMQRYLLQKLLKLSPQVDTVTEAENQGKTPSKVLSTLQSESSPQHMQHCRHAGDLRGTYEHEEHRQLITIYDDGTAEVYYDDETTERSSRMPVVYVSDNKIRILTLQNGCLSIERWAQWRDVEFSVDKHGNPRSLLRDNDRRKYVARN